MLFWRYFVFPQLQIFVYVLLQSSDFSEFSNAWTNVESLETFQSSLDALLHRGSGRGTFIMNTLLMFSSCFPMECPVSYTVVQSEKPYFIYTSYFFISFSHKLRTSFTSFSKVHFMFLYTKSSVACLMDLWAPLEDYCECNLWSKHSMVNAMVCFSCCLCNMYFASIQYISKAKICGDWKIPKSKRFYLRQEFQDLSKDSCEEENYWSLWSTEASNLNFHLGVCACIFMPAFVSVYMFVCI